MQIYHFRFTPINCRPRIQQVRKASFRIFQDSEGSHRAALLVQTTRPEDTVDNRGVADWDAPVKISLTTQPIPAGFLTGDILQVVVGRDQSGLFDNHLEYWDYRDFTATQVVLWATGIGATIQYSAISCDKHKISFFAQVADLTRSVYEP